VAELSREELKQLARLGAIRRLEELRREEAALRAVFPDLFRGRRGGARVRVVEVATEPATATRIRRRPRMSASARRAVSERMKKYWAERRKAKSGRG
jgi:hypothetical protein